MKYSIIVTGYNCEKYAKQCIDSILAQTEKDYEVIVINDCSTDNTKEILESYKQQNIYAFHAVKNLGALQYRYDFAHAFDGDIILFVGLDDYLEPNALEVLNKVYSNPKIRMSYGAWKTPQNTAKRVRAYPSEVFKNKSFRNHEWLATALNSFKCDLLLEIPKEKLINPKTNEFFTNCTDLAYSFPALELCKEDEVAVVKDYIYVYRNDHDNTTLNRLGVEHKTEVRDILRNIKPL